MRVNFFGGEEYQCNFISETTIIFLSIKQIGADLIHFNIQ